MKPAFKSSIYFEALSGMLLTEMHAPFDNGLGHSLDGRLSKASSRDSRSASNADLSDTGRGCINSLWKCVYMKSPPPCKYI